MAYDGFLQIDGIPGESTDEIHADWIEILDYNHAVSQMGGAQVSRAGGLGGERVNIDDFSITKILDKSTPVLAQYCCTAKHIPKIIIELCEATGKKHTYMKYTLSDVIVSEVSCIDRRKQTDKIEELGRPLEQIKFRFGQIQWEYTPVDKMGKAGASTMAGWNLETNAPI